MMDRARRATASLLFLAALPACVSSRRTLPAREPPPRVLPELTMPRTAPADATGRVVFDSITASVDVTEITGRSYGFAHAYSYGGGQAFASSNGETSRFVCVTPCVVDMPAGGHELRCVGGSSNDIERTYSLTMNATPGVTQVYRVALNESTSNLGAWLPGVVLSAIGLAGVGIGGTVLLASQGIDEDSRRSMQTGGIVAGGIGLVLVTTGIFMQIFGRGERRDGAVTHWTISNP